MRTRIVFIALLIIAVLVLISLKIFQDSDGPHGGSVKNAGEYNIEMKNDQRGIYAFLLDGHLKPVRNKKIRCAVKLFYSDSIITDAELEPFGDDGFISESIPPYYSICRVTFLLPEITVSAEFINETLMANEK